MTLNFYKGKKILITGHSGFKGAWLSRILMQAGAEIAGYALQPPTVPSLFAQTKIENDMNSAISDIRDRERLVNMVRDAAPDIVFHMAAQPIVRHSYNKPVMTYETNVMGTVNILEAVRMTPSVSSFVNVTTDKVYENKEWHWGYRENENLCGHDPYSNSKSCSELITHSYRVSFFGSADAPAISAARSGNVIGGGDYAEDRIIPDCVRAARAGTEIIVRNPRSTRPYQHVLECLRGYLLLAEKQYNDKAFEGAYNFGPDDNDCVTTARLADLFCAAWNEVGSGCGAASWRAAKDDGGPHEANFLKLDCSKAKAVLGWQPRWDIKTAVEKTVEFAKLDTDDERTACVDWQIKEYFGIAR